MTPIIKIPANAADGSRSDTFAMIKPDATLRGVEGRMLSVIQDAGFRILELRRARLSRADAEWLYREHAARDHFNDLVDYTISFDAVLLHLDAAGSSAATNFRTLMGATDFTKADPGTLRAGFAVGYRENSIHGSDSAEAAVAEIDRFFPSAKAFWPAEREVADCDPVSVAAMAIRSGCDSAPYNDPNRPDDAKPKREDVLFWDHVAAYADRIASWAIQGLGINERAKGTD